MKNPIGYIIKDSGGELICEGGFGELYDYIWAKNGVFIEAENQHLSARIPVAVGVTRGLADLKMGVTLKHGKIPQRYFDYILDDMLLTPKEEAYYAIVWEEERYKIKKPAQAASADKVTYEQLDNVVLEIHSHGDMSYQFSNQDDSDELGLKVYGVVGLLTHQYPCALLRAGVYGYFFYIEWDNVFEGESTRVNWQFARRTR